MRNHITEVYHSWLVDYQFKNPNRQTVKILSKLSKCNTIADLMKLFEKNLEPFRDGYWRQRVHNVGPIKLYQQLLRWYTELGKLEAMLDKKRIEVAKFRKNFAPYIDPRALQFLTLFEATLNDPNLILHSEASYFLGTGLIFQLGLLNNLILQSSNLIPLHNFEMNLIHLDKSIPCSYTKIPTTMMENKTIFYNAIYHECFTMWKKISDSIKPDEQEKFSELAIMDFFEIYEDLHDLPITDPRMLPSDHVDAPCLR